MTTELNGAIVLLSQIQYGGAHASSIQSSTKHAVTINLTALTFQTTINRTNGIMQPSNLPFLQFTIKMAAKDRSTNHEY